MSELQTEQEHRNQEYKDSLSDIEKTYQKQIDSLKEHLQRIVTESHQKDDLIEQVSGMSAICGSVSGFNYYTRCVELIVIQPLLFGNLLFYKLQNLYM